jgi:hypothetical protein
MTILGKRAIAMPGTVRQGVREARGAAFSGAGAPHEVVEVMVRGQAPPGPESEAFRVLAPLPVRRTLEEEREPYTVGDPASMDGSHPVLLATQSLAL